MQVTQKVRAWRPLIGSTATLGIFASLLSAQYMDLTTTADGSIVYFSTWLRRSGIGDPEQGRVYTIGSAGMQTFAERQREVLPGSPTVTNYYWFSAPDVSGDGRTVAISALRDCLSGRQCIGVQTTETTITGINGRNELTVRGRIRLSPNGRYALRQAPLELGGDTGGLLDLVTGEESLASKWERGLGLVTYPGLPVSNDGSVVHLSNNTVLLNRGTAARHLTDLSQESASSPVIDAGARVVVYASRWRHPHSAFSRIRVIELGSGSRRTLIESFGDFYEPVISHDGRRVLFLTNSRFDGSARVRAPQAYVVGIDGQGLRAATQEPSGIQRAILSGNGRMVYAVTRSGRLLRVDLDTMVETELLPRTVWPRETHCDSSGPAVGGSLRRITGVGYPGGDGTPETVRVRFGGIEAPIVSQSPGELLIQTPWELAGQTVRIDLETSAPPGPFEQPVSHDAYVASSAPCFLPLPEEYGTDGPYGMRYSLAVDANFGGLATPHSPVRPGAIVNLYGLGFGPAHPAVPTGEAAPVGGPLSRVTARLECETFSLSAKYPVPVLFAGLAPGTIGVYQVQLRIPAELMGNLTYADAIQVACRDSGGTGSSSFVALLPIRFDLPGPAQAVHAE